MVATTVPARGEAAESLALGALDWLLGSARGTKEGLTWAAAVPGAEANFTLYHGSAGIVLTLLEAQRHFGDDRFGDAALRGAAAIAAAADHEESCSLYFGLAGMAVALHAVHVQLGDSSAGAAARRALDRVRSRFDGQRWGVMFEVLGGNAGIALGALQAGDPELAVLGAEPYLRTADHTPGGVNWAVRPSPARSHHIAHGTLGIAYALAAVGTAAGRRALVEPRAPCDAEHARPAHRMGDGQRRHHPRTAAVCPRQHRKRPVLRGPLARPSWRARAWALESS
jgi:hypothetical protein